MSIDAHMAKYSDINGVGPDTDKTAEFVKMALAGAGNHSSHGTLAKVYEGLNCPTLKIEWTLEVYWANVARKNYPILMEIYNKLVAHDYTRKNRFEYNDMDNHTWYIPHNELKVFVHTSQNHNLLFILPAELDGWNKYHIRRYWDDLKCPNAKTNKLGNEFYKDDEAAFLDKVKKSGRKAALIEHNLEDYSDNVLNYPYPRRPNLDYFTKSNYVPKYRDGRDDGYVLTLDSMTNRVDWAIHQHGLLKAIFDCYIPSTHAELLLEEN